MKICILSVLHEPFDKRVFHKIARSLSAHGHEVTSIAPSTDAIAPRDGVAFIPIKVAKSLPDRFLSVFRLLREGRKIPADVYLAVEPESWVAALLLKALTRRKVVFDVHEYIPTEFAKFFPKFLFGAMVAQTIMTMRLFARFTDHIILTKSCLDRDFEGLRTPRTVVLNTNHAQPPCLEIDPELHARYADRPTVIHQGQFGDVRGSYQLLEAMRIMVRELPEAKCILLGEYLQGDEAAYRRAVVEAGLNDAIHFLGKVPFEQVPQYIAVSRVGLILFQPIGLGHTLGMPHKMFDYMREGIPFVGPDFVLEIKRIVDEADCALLVNVTSPEAIAAAVLRLLRNPDEAKRLGENGRRMVETKYNWSYDEQRLLEVFASLSRI